MAIATQNTLPIYVFGDSHVLPVRNRVFREKWAGSWCVTKTKYISGLTAHDFFNIEKREFHPEFIEALEYEGLIRNGKATHLSLEEIDFNIARAEAVPVTSPLILLAMGDIDIRLILLPMLKDQFDFHPPFETPYKKINKSLLLWDIVEDTMRQRIQPFIEGIKALRDAGFNRVYVQLVTPPTMDEKNFQDRHGYSCPAEIRYKTVFTFNRLLSEYCSQLNVPIIDVWPLVTENDYLKSEYELDGVHLPPSAAIFNLSLLLEHAINCQWEALNHSRYEIYYRMACEEKQIFDPPSESDNPIGNKLQHSANEAPRQCTKKAPKTIKKHAEQWINLAAEEFQKNGICVLKANPETVERWRQVLAFDRGVGNTHSAWDWAGNSIQPYSDVLRTALPPITVLNDLKTLLCQPEYDAFFRSILGCPVTVMNCRPVQSIPHESSGIGPQSWHEDGCPAGIIRGVLYLTDVDEVTGPFQYKAPDGTPVTVTGKSGDFLIFDAMRLSHRAMPPTEKTRTALDFVFMPRLSYQPLEIIMSGMNHWPADPFCFSIPVDKSNIRNSNNITDVEVQPQSVVNSSNMFAAEYHKLRAETLAMLNSTSWQVTAPLRQMMRMVRKLKYVSEK